MMDKSSNGSCCEKMGVKKGQWTPEEDRILISFIKKNGHGNWRALPNQAGLQRCGKSCRLRWMNYLRPDIKRGNFTKHEEETIINLHQMLGNRWSAIAARLPGRTDNEIKNVWHTHLKKRLEHHTYPSPDHQMESKTKYSNVEVVGTNYSSPTSNDVDMLINVDQIQNLGILMDSSDYNFFPEMFGSFWSEEQVRPVDHEIELQPLICSPHVVESRDGYLCIDSDQLVNMNNSTAFWYNLFMRSTTAGKEDDIAQF